MKDQSQKSSQTTSRDSRSVTSSQALPDGLTLCGLPDGDSTGESHGQVPAPARARLLFELSIVLALAGLSLAQFVGLLRLGMVVSLVAFIVFGAHLFARYVAWESNDES